VIFPLLDTPLTNAQTNTPIRIRFRPLIPLRVAGPNGRLIDLEALVDTGADEVLLPDTLLPAFGFASGSGITRGTSGIGGRTTVVFHPIRLEIRANPNDRIAWHATVGFAKLSLHVAMFGLAGGLEFFHTTLNVIDRQLGLFPHPTIPLAAPCVSPHVAFSVP